MQRRGFIKLSAGMSALTAMPFGKLAFAKDQVSSSPIQILSAGSYQTLEFTGDNIDKPHDGLWNPDGVAAKQGGWPRPTEHVDLAIIGGGISGLLSAYYFADRKPIIFESDVKFGGNSKAEKLNSSIFSIGAAYIIKPEQDSELAKLLVELGLDKLGRVEQSEDTHLFFKNRLFKDFWKGVTDPNALDQFAKVEQALQKVYDESYPDIPWDNSSDITWDQLKILDSISFKKWLLDQFSELHPHVEEYFQLYAWSSFTASIDEISAAQMLNFITAEIDGVLAFPGGNAAISQKLYDRIPQKQLRPNSLVIRTEIKQDKVFLYFLDKDNVLRCTTANQVIMACQKFVAKRICIDMPEDQKSAIQKMTYRGYIVANAVYGKKVNSPGYDLYCLEGEVPENPMAMKPSPRGFADIVMGNWAIQDSSNETVLTIYRPLAYDGARQFLFADGAHNKHLKFVEQALLPYESALGLDRSDLKGIRMTRWGHSLPVASVGFIAKGYHQIVNRSIQDKIFFANQDNWSNPAFETSFSAVLSLKDQLK